MIWILVLTIVTYEGISNQQIQMSELNCRHYETQYNSGVHDKKININGSVILVAYRAQCLKIPH